MNEGRLETVERAVEARLSLLDERHEAALRLFAGFYEGNPDLVIDLYGRTLLFHNYASQPEQALPFLQETMHYLLKRFPWIQCVVLKTRQGKTAEKRRGEVLYGKEMDRRICENHIWYAVDLLLNRDSSFYLDTRNLRLWASQNLQGQRVLNAFAYTGSLGVASLAGGAGQVVHLDRNRAFLNLAKTSYTLNGLPVQKTDFLTGDFFVKTSQMRRRGELFGCVFLDPPFFSTSGAGTVDLLNQSERLINKVRPLVRDGGRIAAMNNALFISGAEYWRSLENLCSDGYLSIEATIPIPPDITGFPQTILAQPPVDPAPFNHPTKIAVLKVKKKS
ncbi:MAG: class I SAM-dependent methyltransferase [Omnitrophica WOR_2 bacterium]